MADVETPIETLRDRLTGLLADWGAEFSMVLKELEANRARLKELEESGEGRGEELERLQNKLGSHEELIQVLRADAEEASSLRRETHGKDVELERLSSELESKNEIIAALRKDAEMAGRLQASFDEKDQRIAELTEELSTLRETAVEEVSQDSIELEAVRAELDARKTLISSLRADADRLGALEANLEEKRNVIAKLETSMNRQAGTISELKESISNWQNRYANLKASGKAEGSSTELPSLSDTDLRELENLEGEERPERTIAIDMRDSLLEARRSSIGRK